jgi:pimeloyl-ACP methyl ester carboxylesterase
MDYVRLYEHLKSHVSFDTDRIDLDPRMSVHNFTFQSRHADLLPGQEETPHSEAAILDVPDTLVAENRSFRYHVFQPRSRAKSEGMILVLHGFNEKNWNKYLPWAAKLVESTGKAVVLFPLAFHMNRAPSPWSDARLMRAVSNRRKEEFPEILHSSLLNAAISTRLHRNPQRFIWSGLQTFEDIRDFVAHCREGAHPLFEKDPTVDLMAYSIGGFLSEVLLLSDPDTLFSKSRLFILCGGPVFNRISPVSKFILDSEANVRLYSYLVEHLESHLKHDSKLFTYLNDTSGTGVAFRSMLSYQHMADFREAGFRRMTDRIAAVALAGDEVIPPYEVENTLRGRTRNIPISVETFDFSYPYRHEDPFPALARHSSEVNTAFHKVFEAVGAFLK